MDGNTGPIDQVTKSGSKPGSYLRDFSFTHRRQRISFAALKVDDEMRSRVEKATGTTDPSAKEREAKKEGDDPIQRRCHGRAAVRLEHDNRRIPALGVVDTVGVRAHHQRLWQIHISEFVYRL